jgi:uncharacterized membrane protein YidH (DUF202 family)
MPADSKAFPIPVRTVLFLLAGLQLAGTPVAGCALCRPAVHAQVYNGDFPLNLMAMFFPIATVLALGLAVLNWERMARAIRKGKEAFRWKRT